MNQQLVKKLAVAATAFALVVVLLGAFTRLSHAGLGCPDWPGCYGFSHIPTDQQDISAANEAFPERPYEFAKAWPEMVHRYFAGTLGLLVLGLAILSFKRENNPAKKHSIALLILIIFQAALGMWTVTMKLHPGIVMTHLMGGLATFMLLGSLSLRYIYQFENSQPLAERNRFKTLSIIAFLVLLLQVALGGWTSANYAATICYELPICQSNWWKESDFTMGFTIWGHGAEDYEFGILDSGARIAIHAAHRIGAIITSVVIAFLCFKLIQQNLSMVLKRIGQLLAVLLLVQVTLGVFNIIFDLPLYNAVAHNGVGALLLLTMAILLTYLVMPEKNEITPGNSND